MNMNFTFTQAKRFHSNRDSSGGEDEDEDSCEEELAGFHDMVKMPRTGKKTRGRVKVKMEFIKSKLRRYTTFSKRKTGIMKKAYELATLTGTQVMVLVASETGHVYTFATQKLQPMITSEAGKALIQTCLNSPDTGGPGAGQTGAGGPGAAGNCRMTETGYEEQDLTYNVHGGGKQEQHDDEDEAEEFESVDSKLQVLHDEASDDPSSPPISPVPHSAASSSMVSRPSSPDLILPHHPVMQIPPHILDQLMKSVPTSSTSLTSPPSLDFSNLQSKIKKSTDSLFRPIEPDISQKQQPLNKPLPLNIASVNRDSENSTKSVYNILSSLTPSLTPQTIDATERSRILQFPDTKVRRK